MRSRWWLIALAAAVLLSTLLSGVASAQEPWSWDPGALDYPGHEGSCMPDGGLSARSGQLWPGYWPYPSDGAIGGFSTAAGYGEGPLYWDGLDFLFVP